MRLPDWLKTKHTRRTSPGEVTVTLTADVSKFTAAMYELEESLRRQRHRAAVAQERIAARRWWTDYADQAWARYGWERP